MEKRPENTREPTDINGLTEQKLPVPCQKIACPNYGVFCYYLLIGRSVVYFSGIPHPHLLGDRAPDLFYRRFDRDDVEKEFRI